VEKIIDKVQRLAQEYGIIDWPIRGLMLDPFGALKRIGLRRDKYP